MAQGNYFKCSFYAASLVLAFASGANAQPDEAHRVTNSSTGAIKAGPAAKKFITGWVLSMDGADVVVDLGADHGLHEGDLIELWRPVKLKHPITGKVVTDRFRTGNLTLVQVRGNLSWARPVGSLDRPVAIGDFVQRAVSPDTAGTPESARTPTEASASHNTNPSLSAGSETPQPDASRLTARDADAIEVAQLFEALQGHPPLDRAANYEHFVRTHRTRFARPLLEEAAILRGQTEGREAEATGVVHQVTIPDTVRPNRPLVIGLWMPGKHAGAVLQVRADTEPSYRPLPMKLTSPDYYEVVIPAEMMAPGVIALCIERVESDGKAYPLEGTASEPLRVTVRSEPEQAESSTHHGLVRLVTDYADWNRGRGNDYAWQTEGDIGIRLEDKGLRALRSGFGVYRGKGGTLDELDVYTVAPRSVGLTYGYLEGEFGFSSFVSLVGRATVGLGKDGVAGGGQAFVRLGNDLTTNLMLGGEVLGGIGLRGIAQLELKQFELFPIMLRSEVTNQPVGERSTVDSVSPGVPVVRDASDVGVRVIAQVGYRVLPSLTLALRGSYQGRTINHAGPGGGGAVIYAF